MRNKVAKTIRKNMEDGQTKREYKLLKKIYKALSKTIKNKLGKNQAEERRRKGIK